MWRTKPVTLCIFIAPGAGRKWDILTKEPPVCLVRRVQGGADPRRADHRLQVRPRAGRAVLVQDTEEKMYALKLLVQALDPVSMSRAVLCAEHSMQRTMLVKIVSEIITGKESFGD